MATVKLRIDNNAVVDGFFDDVRLIGLVAPIPDYRLCWHLNQNLTFDFRINHDLEIKLIRKGREYFFSIFECCEGGGTLNHYLYNNQCEGEYLLPEFRHLDYLWLIKDDIISDEELNNLVTSIRSTPSIQLIQQISIDKIKNRQNLIF